MKTEFKSGDVVRLKSGGPAMTVSRELKSETTARPAVECVWYDEVTNTFSTSTFAQVNLVETTPDLNSQDSKQ